MGSIGISNLTHGKGPLLDANTRPELLKRVQRLYESLIDCALFQASGSQVDYKTPEDWQLQNLQEWNLVGSCGGHIDSGWRAHGEHSELL